MLRTPTSHLEADIHHLLDKHNASSDQGCSALANVLLRALVQCRRDPRVTARVSEEMRRLAARIVELAGQDLDHQSTADDLTTRFH